MLLNLAMTFNMAALITSVVAGAANLTFAGVDFPDTPSVRASLKFAEEYLDEPTLNHVTRSTVFALMTRSKVLALDPNSPLATSDAEVIAVSTILHDMSWNVTRNATHQFISQDKRFEVDGANVARDFLTQLTNSSTLDAQQGWNQTRLQLVWDAIALHSTASIGQYKQPEVILSGYGIFLDVAATPDQPLAGIPYDHRVTQQEFDQVYTAIPAPGFTEYLKNIGCGLCFRKPDTTYDNIVGTYGAEWIEGFSLVGHGGVDLLLRRAQQEGIQNYTEKVTPQDLGLSA